MKKLILALIFAVVAVQFAVAAPKQTVEQRVEALNKQVDGTLSEEQVEQITEIYKSTEEKIATGNLKAGPGYRQAITKAAKLLTPEQAEVRAKAMEEAQANK